MKRKLTISAFLALALGLLASCGGDEKEPGKGGDPGFGKTNTKKTPGNSGSGKPEGTGKTKGSGKGVKAAKGTRNFEENDRNGDGFITEDEVEEVAWSFISKADADGDGKVSQEERRNARSSGQIRPEPSEMIDLLDKDGDGFIAVDEMSDQMRERLGSADTDGDGKVSLEEIEASRTARSANRPGGRRPGGGRLGGNKGGKRPAPGGGPGGRGTPPL